MATEYLFSNNATTTLAQSVSSTATVLNVTSGDGSLFPSPASGQAFAVTLVDAATGLTNEICYCTSRSGDHLTVIRGREGTNATSWQAGDTCASYITAGNLENFLQQNESSQFLRVDSTTEQDVSSPVKFSGITTVPTPTDYGQNQAIGASDADARYAPLSMMPFTDTKLRFQVIQATISYGTLVSWPKAFASDPVFITAYAVRSTTYYPIGVLVRDMGNTGALFYAYDFPPPSDGVDYVPGTNYRYAEQTVYIMVGGYF